MITENIPTTINEIINFRLLSFSFMIISCLSLAVIPAYCYLCNFLLNCIIKLWGCQMQKSYITVKYLIIFSVCVV